MTATLTTSLAEIRSFNPSAPRWKNALTARKPQCSADYTIQFSLVDYLESSSVADVCWLLGKRKKEIQICVRFAQMCADSVKDLNSKYAATAAAYAYATANAAAAAYAAAANQLKLNKQFLTQCINEYQS